MLHDRYPKHDNDIDLEVSHCAPCIAAGMGYRICIGKIMRITVLIISTILTVVIRPGAGNLLSAEGTILPESFTGIFMCRPVPKSNVTTPMGGEATAGSECNGTMDS